MLPNTAWPVIIMISKADMSVQEAEINRGGRCLLFVCGEGWIRPDTVYKPFINMTILQSMECQRSARPHYGYRVPLFDPAKGDTVSLIAADNLLIWL